MSAPSTASPPSRQLGPPSPAPRLPIHHGAWLLLGLALALLGVQVSAALGAGADPWGAPSTDALLAAGAWTRERLVDGQWWRVLTAWTAHASLVHLGLNLGCWAVAGGYCVRRFGPAATFGVFALSAVAGHVASAAAGNPASAGASGGAYGLLGWILADLWRRRSAHWVTWGLPILLGLVVLLPAGGDRVDRWAHGAGAAAGLLPAWLDRRQLERLLAPLAVAVVLTSSGLLAFGPLGPPQLDLPEASPGVRLSFSRGAELAARAAPSAELVSAFPDLAKHIPPAERCVHVRDDGTVSAILHAPAGYLTVVSTTAGNWRRYAAIVAALSGGRCRRK